jgi:hypothetical protein
MNILDQIDENIFDVDSRLIAIEIAFKALVVSLHQSEALNRESLLRELSRATNETEESIGRNWPETVVQLDLLHESLAGLLQSSPSTGACT